MSNKALEAWAWVLIYGGLLLVMLGLYLRADGAGGVFFQVIGALVALAGVVLIVIRARRPRDGD